MPGVNNDFIRQLEGFSTSGYVPLDKQGNPLEQSGITIGTGIDLGQQSVADLRRMGVSEDVLKAIKPYVGIRGTAIKQLDPSKLNLLEDQVRELDEAVMNQSYANLAKHFNAASPRKFEELPEEFQTVMASINHQYGSSGLRKTNFWKQMTSGQYDDALANLRNFRDNYPTRRNKEADLFQRGIIAEFLGGQ
jgi:GH24 family phage-related lysozyme (muramidase)